MAEELSHMKWLLYAGAMIQDVQAAAQVDPWQAVQHTKPQPEPAWTYIVYQPSLIGQLYDGYWTSRRPACGC